MAADDQVKSTDVATQEIEDNAMETKRQEEILLENDPHRAALEANPVTPEGLNKSTILAILVSFLMLLLCI